jgi:hypothetical protein
MKSPVGYKAFAISIVKPNVMLLAIHIVFVIYGFITVLTDGFCSTYLVAQEVETTIEFRMLITLRAIKLIFGVLMPQSEQPSDTHLKGLC